MQNEKIEEFKVMARRGWAAAARGSTNGRNLWVHWRRIDKDALVVVVDVKLPYPGGSTAYYDAVGQCNVLIAKAIVGMPFAAISCTVPIWAVRSM